MVVNDTRVIPARLVARKQSGGKAEVFLLNELGRGQWRCLIRPSRGISPHTVLTVGDDLLLSVLDGGAGEFTIQTKAPREVLLARGAVPLPPYIKRPVLALDIDRYATVYGRAEGSVAAPTAGLHFTKSHLDELCREGRGVARVTLHIGLGTFAPVRETVVEDHAIHQEPFFVDEENAKRLKTARQAGTPLIAVGTTSVRVLETVSQDENDGPVSGVTGLFIYPPYRFRAVDHLITNFHAPRSTLLALVYAFGGVPLICRAYQEALDKGYRFLSYGDAMLIV